MSNYIKCPECELNYITRTDKFCSQCIEKKAQIKRPHIDSNKNLVERDLLPILRKLNPTIFQSLIKKEDSFRLLGLRLPLLVKEGDKITDDKGHARYYVQPYDINGEYYHICSQWWSASGNNSKDILKLLSEITIK